MKAHLIEIVGSGNGSLPRCFTMSVLDRYYGRSDLRNVKAKTVTAFRERGENWGFGFSRKDKDKKEKNDGDGEPKKEKEKEKWTSKFDRLSSRYSFKAPSLFTSKEATPVKKDKPPEGKKSKVETSSTYRPDWKSYNEPTDANLNKLLMKYSWGANYSSSNNTSRRYQHMKYGYPHYYGSTENEPVLPAYRPATRPAIYNHPIKRISEKKSESSESKSKSPSVSTMCMSTTAKLCCILI